MIWKENTKKEHRAIADFAVSEGYLPLAPTRTHSSLLDDEDIEERELGLHFALVLLGKCEELWVLTKFLREWLKKLLKAKRRNIPIRYFDSKMRGA